MAPIGRQSLIHDERIRSRLIDALKAGCTRADAALYAGSHERTLRDWLARARHDEAEGMEHSPYVAMAEAIERAEGEARAPQPSSCAAACWRTPAGRSNSL
jgi:hypothetical protein